MSPRCVGQDHLGLPGNLPLRGRFGCLDNTILQIGIFAVHFLVWQRTLNIAIFFLVRWRS